MAIRNPAVMVSSTFYDLRQLRADLTEFLISQMGYTPLLSELDSFPIDPSVEAIENCRRRVEKDVDILVLVIGGRYGYVDTSSAKSVTNLEYLAARSKGIPIYAFVKRDVLSAIPLWKKNPDADFSSVVDDARVFAFVEEVRSVHNVWTHEFDTAQQVTATLRAQFAVLMHEGLVWSRRFRGEFESDTVKNLHGKALRLALERPSLWEYRLLFQVVLDELQSHSPAKRDHELGLVLGVASYISIENFTDWSARRMAELQRIAGALSTLLGGPLQDALGPPGTPGDSEKIVFIAQRIGRAYSEALEWTQRMRRAAGDGLWAPMLEEMARFAEGILLNIENWAKRGDTELAAALPRVAAGERPELDFTLKIELGGDIDKYLEKISQIEETVTRRRPG